MPLLREHVVGGKSKAKEKLDCVYEVQFLTLALILLIPSGSLTSIPLPHSALGSSLRNPTSPSQKSSLITLLRSNANSKLNI